MLGNRGSGVLSHLPAANAEQEPNDIGLLLLLDLFDVLEGTHLRQLRVSESIRLKASVGMADGRTLSVVGCRCRNCKKFEGERSKTEVVCGTLAISRVYSEPIIVTPHSSPQGLRCLSHDYHVLLLALRFWSQGYGNTIIHPQTRTADYGGRTGTMLHKHRIDSIEVEKESYGHR